MGAANKICCALSLFWLLLAPPAALAQYEESAAIIQTTIMSFRLTGAASNNFSQSTQTTFSDSLRSLLSSYNFMSLAVNDFKTGSGFVDVSVRAVDATDAQNCTSKWQNIAMRNVQTGTFMSAFNALLQNSGLQGNATLTNVEGASTPAGVNVTFAVNLTLSQGMNLTPFTENNQKTLLTPINTFLGDHGRANITSTATQGSNAVAVTMDVVLDANTMPQFWFFLYNQTTLQYSLPALGGNSLNTTVGNYTVLGSEATPNPAPVPAASAPVEASSGPVTAQQVTNSPTVPPVTSSSSGTVTMNIAMTLFGSSMQPFTSEKQFAAASALAGVFWIIVGTGSVNVISFNTLPNAAESPATAKSTPAYGRRLLQTSQPAENVVFSVTLPTASQNSLLVLQSQSATVRQQFAGWFVTQMAARGYTVDAELTNVSVSSVTPATTTPTPPPSASVTTTNNAPAPPAGGSSNGGKIAGGVVGGVVGLALLALVAFFTIRKLKKSKTNGKGEDLTPSSSGSDDIKGAVYGWTPNNKHTKHNPIYTKDMDDLKKTIESTLSGGSSGINYKSNLWDSPLYTNLSELSSAHQEEVRHLLDRRHQQESQGLTETSANQAEALLSALAALEVGSLYYDKYVMEHEKRKSMNSIIAYAHCKNDKTQEVVIKFLPDHGHFQHERLFYENRQALEAQDALVCIPNMVDAFAGTDYLAEDDDDAIPPSLVLERGNFTLAEYLSGQASLRGKPEEIDRSQILFHLSKCVEFMHVRSLVHGSLTPDSLMWFSKLGRWKMMGFGNWARSNERMQVVYDLHYAAPELVLADLGRMQTISADPATDMWALGCIAYELLTGKPVFGPQHNDEEIMSMLLGLVKLPWEENPDFFIDSLPPAARGLIADLLHRSPEARKPITTVLHSPLFMGENAGDRQAPETLRTPAGIYSTASNWA